MTRATGMMIFATGTIDTTFLLRQSWGLIVRRDAVLQIGGMTETVNVEASAVLLATENATISESIGERAVEELPMTGRNVWSLAGTTPGVLSGTSLSLDGINSAANLLTSTSMRPIADAVTEVEVQTGSTSAECGSSLGVHVNVVTKSGTNEVHGPGYEFFQHDALDARGFFEDPDEPLNPRRRDQFGFQFDGPAVIPKLYDGRNKTFFMMAYEGVREDETGTSIVSVPTPLMRQGNFSEFRGTIRYPLTGQVYPGNIIPASELSPIARRVLEFYPLPNREDTGSDLVANEISSDATDQILVRVDQNIGNKVRLYARHNWQDQLATSIPINGGGGPNTNNNLLVAHTQTSRLLNDFRIIF